MTLGGEDDSLISKTGQSLNLRHLIAAAGILAGTALLAGCVSSAAPNVAVAPTGPVASSEPLILNTTPRPGARTDVTTAHSADGTTPPAADATASAAPAATPADTTAAPAADIAAAPTTDAAPADDSVTATSFPNINEPPKEPGGRVLSPEERAKMIAELEALKKRQGGGTPAAPKLTKEQIAKKCADATVAATDPDCLALKQ